VTERIQRSYDLRASVAAVLAGLTDENAVRRRSDADGLGTRVVRHEVTVDAVRIVVETDIPLDWLPSTVTSRLGRRRPSSGRRSGRSMETAHGRR